MFKQKNNATEIHTTERFESFFHFCTALFTLLIMTAKSILSKRSVLRITVGSSRLDYFRPLFVSIPNHVYFIFVKTFLLKNVAFEISCNF